MNEGKCPYMKGKACPNGCYAGDYCIRCNIPLFYKLDELNRNLSTIAQRL